MDEDGDAALGADSRADGDGKAAAEGGAADANADGSVPPSDEPRKETVEEAAARRRAEMNVLRRASALREAQAKATRAAETPPYEAPRGRCHWDYVLAEMAWMAADFAGERLWKLCAAECITGACDRR